MKVFISYCHRDGDWVWDRLVPVLKAGGAEVLIDRERFAAGKGVVGQADHWQDQADRQVLVITTAYLASDYCRRELQRAVARDPYFRTGIVLPVRRDDVAWPDPFSRFDAPLYADLREDGQALPWRLLLDACAADLGTAAPAWLGALDEIVRRLRNRESVNLIAVRPMKWPELLKEIGRGLAVPASLPSHMPGAVKVGASPPAVGLPEVDLEDPRTVDRDGLLQVIMERLGAPPNAGKADFIAFGRFLEAYGGGRLAITHFHHAADPQRKYGSDLFRALRFAIQNRRLILLIQSRAPINTFLPPDHAMSELNLTAVPLPPTS